MHLNFLICGVIFQSTLLTIGVDVRARSPAPSHYQADSLDPTHSYQPPGLNPPTLARNPGVGICQNCVYSETNATCRRISGLFTRPSLPLGYNVIAQLPIGACNVAITELRISKNYLALRDLTGNYIINGKWNIDRSGSYLTAGTTFTYKRHDVRRSRSESLTALGPLTEPLYLLLIYQQPNLGIKYEYSIPVIIRHPQPLPSVGLASRVPSVHPNEQQHQHRHGHNSEVERSTWSNDAAEGDDGRNRKRNKDGIKKTGNREKGRGRQKKSFRWKIFEDSLTDCSATCGEGYQTQIVECVRVLLPEGKDVLAVDERHCKGQMRPLVNRVPCNVHLPCPFEVKTIGRKSDEKLTKSVWKSYSWSQCNTRCGPGNRSRIVQCVDNSYPEQESHSCLEEDKPNDFEPCYGAPCNSTWLVSDWDGQCSLSCGPDLLLRRRVFCSDHLRTREGTSDSVLTRSTSHEEEAVTSCDRRKRPLAEKTCHSMLKEQGIDCGGVGQWLTGAWSQCSSTCGEPGWQIRIVMCIVQDKTTPNENCPQPETPTSRQKCNPGPCPVSQETTVEKPSWYTSEWYQCSKPCGGTQERDVVCLTLDGRLSHECDNEQKPSPNRICSDSGTEKQCEQLQCEDKDSYCHLVARARLCRYDHYRDRCCQSCENKLKSS